MVSILTLGPLPERPLFCCCSFQTGIVSVLSGLSETERQTILSSLSLSRGEWELVIQINTFAGRLLFLQRQCFKEICFAIPIKLTLIKSVYWIWFTSKGRFRIQAPCNVFFHPDCRPLNIFLETD